MNTPQSDNDKANKDLLDAIVEGRVEALPDLVSKVLGQQPLVMIRNGRMATHKSHLVLLHQEGKLDQDTTLACYQALTQHGIKTTLSALDAVCREGVVWLLDVMLQREPHLKPMLERWDLRKNAVVHGHMDILERIQHHKQNIHAIYGPRGETLLHAAAEHALGDEAESIIATLATYGCDPNLAGGIRSHTRALHVAKTPQAINALIKIGADVNSPNDVNKTPLFYVPNIACADALLCHGADVNWIDSRGRSAIWTVWRNTDDAALVGYLLNQGVPVIGEKPERMNDTGDDDGILLILSHQKKRALEAVAGGLSNKSGQKPKL